MTREKGTCQCGSYIAPTPVSRATKSRAVRKGRNWAEMRRKHSTRRAVLVLAVLVQTVTVAAQVVETIEPPSWWVERDEQELLLLIEGSGLDGAQVRVAHGPIKVARIEPGRQGHAVF